MPRPSFHSLLLRVQKLRAGVRCWSLNRNAGVKIAASARLNPRAVIDLQGDGWVSGGTVSVGAGTTLASGAMLAPYGGSIQIGTNVYVGPYTVIYGHGGVIIGNDVLIAAHCTIVPANHTWSDPHLPIRGQPISAQGIEIQAGVWLGSGVRVLDGVVIGHGTVVGAGAVVTKSLPPMVIAVGVPAKIAGSRDANVR